MDISKIMSLLPHRYPMLLVDRVTELIPFESIIAYKNITVNEDVFNGHFPSNPIFPGVMTIEALAQVSGLLGFASTETTGADGKLYLFAGVDNVRFKKPVIPGDKLILKSAVMTVKRNIWRFDTQAIVDDGVVCKAELLCAYVDAENNP